MLPYVYLKQSSLDCDIIIVRFYFFENVAFFSISTMMLLSNLLINEKDDLVVFCNPSFGCLNQENSHYFER